jgi:hypothetical protein
MKAGVPTMTSIRKGLAFGTILSILLAASSAFAANDFDGTWVIDVPPAGSISQSSDYTCPALRFPIDVKNGVITGSLTRVPSSDGAVVVEQGSGPVSAPVTGTVQPDGSLTAEWLNYHADGKLAAKQGVVTIKGECGPRQATVFRVQ